MDRRTAPRRLHHRQPETRPERRAARFTRCERPNDGYPVRKVEQTQHMRRRRHAKPQDCSTPLVLAAHSITNLRASRNAGLRQRRPGSPQLGKALQAADAGVAGVHAFADVVDDGVAVVGGAWGSASPPDPRRAGVASSRIRLPRRAPCPCRARCSASWKEPSASFVTLRRWAKMDLWAEPRRHGRQVVFGIRPVGAGAQGQAVGGRVHRVEQGLGRRGGRHDPRQAEDRKGRIGPGGSPCAHPPLRPPHDLAQEVEKVFAQAPLRQIVVDGKRPAETVAVEDEFAGWNPADQVGFQVRARSSLAHGGKPRARRLDPRFGMIGLAPLRLERGRHRRQKSTISKRRGVAAMCMGACRSVRVQSVIAMKL